MTLKDLERLSGTDDLLLERVWFNAMAWQARTARPVFELYVSTWDDYEVTGDKYRYYFSRLARYYSDEDQARMACRHLNHQAMDIWPDDQVDEVPVYSIRIIHADGGLSRSAA